MSIHVILYLYLSFVVFPTIILLQILDPSFSKEELQVLQERTVHGRWRGPQSKPRSGLLASPSITNHSNFSVKMCFIFNHISTRLDESASQSAQG